MKTLADQRIEPEMLVLVAISNSSVKRLLVLSYQQIKAHGPDMGNPTEPVQDAVCTRMTEHSSELQKC